MNPIESFSGRYRFLSNFYPTQVVLDGAVYPSVEHAFQARKTDIQAVREVIRNAKTAGQAKALSRNVTLVSDWDLIRVPVMLGFLQQKFSGQVLRAELLATGDAQLTEGNTWGDVFWGVCKGRGENMLGKLLMAIRDEISKNK